MNPFREIKDATVLSPVAERGVRQFMLETPNETLKVRIAANDYTEEFEKKVNSLVGAAVDIVISNTLWSFEDKRGVIHYLQSIEESK